MISYICQRARSFDQRFPLDLEKEYVESVKSGFFAPLVFGGVLYIIGVAPEMFQYLNMAQDINPPLVVLYMPTSPQRILQHILGDALISRDAPRRF